MDTTKLDDLLNEAEAQEENQTEWTLDQKYDVKNFYVDEHGIVDIKDKTIGDMSKHISVKGESYSQYIEFKMNRFYDGIDLTNMLLAIYYDVPNVGSDESKPINVYYNETEIKFGWAIPVEVVQTNLTIDLCVYARGKLSDGKNYLLKTKTAKYTISDGLELGSGVIQPTNNWYTNFVFEMDSKVQIATDAANSSLNSYNAAKEAETIILQSKQIVEEKSEVVDTQYKEILTMHKEAEQYRDESFQFRNEAEQFSPDGYSALVEQVNKNTVKVDTIIEKADLGIQETVTGEQIHLTDSADSKVKEFALYGKAKQNTTTGKNLIPYPYYDKTKTLNGISWIDNGDGSITASGTADATNSFIFNHRIDNTLVLGAGEYIVSGCPSGGSNTTYRIVIGKSSSAGSFELVAREFGSGATFTLAEDTDIYVAFEVLNGATLSNLVVKPMLRLASITDDTWEQPTNGATPRPDYPQEIEVAGASGSVEVKSVGKNLIPYPYQESSVTREGVAFTDNGDGTITANGTGTGTGTSNYYIRTNMENAVPLSKGTYILSLDGMTGQSTKTYVLRARLTDDNGKTYYAGHDANEGGRIINVTKDNTKAAIYIFVASGYTVNNLTFKPMLRKCDENGKPIGDDTYEPYKETKATIPTNGLAGIPVSSGGNYTDSNGQQWICDEIVKYADGSGEYVQKVGRVISSNTDGWYKIGGSQNQEDRFGIEIGVKMLPHVGLSNYHYKVDNWGTGDNCIGFGVGESTTIYARFNGIESLETLNEKFNNVPFTAYYGLAEPIRTPLTAEQIAEIEKVCTFYHVTNISNDAECGMKVTYLADSKIYIDNQLAIQAQAQEEAMAAMLLLLPEEKQAAMIENDTNNLLAESEE